MNATLWYKNFLLSVIFSSSVVITGGAIQSNYMSDASFMKDDEIQFAKRQDETRYVASAERELPSVQYFPKNETNDKLIGGQWIITRIEDEKGHEIHNYKKNGREILVDFDLKATSLVRIDGNNDYLFDISLMSYDYTAIALFRAYNEGYEIIEARRLRKSEAVKLEGVELASKKLEEGDIKEGVEENLDINILDRDLMIERAHAPTLSRTIIINNPDEINESQTISGFVNANTQYINKVEATVKTEKGEISINLDTIELQAGGVFTNHEQDGAKHAGIMTRNGEGSIKVRFSEGPYKGVLLSFVNDEEMTRISEERMKTREELESAQIENSERVSDLQVVQTDVADQRKGVAADQNGIDVSYRDAREERYETEYEGEYEGEFNEDGTFEEYQDDIIDEGAISEDEFEGVVEETGYAF